MAKKLYKNKDWLIQKYVSKTHSSIEIAKMVQCNPSTIIYWIKKYKIKIRGNKGIKRSESFKRKVSRNHADISGKNNPMWGKKHKPETIEKIKKARLKQPCVLFGRKLSNETKEKIRLALSGPNNPFYGKPSPFRGKSLEEIHGIEKAKKIKKELSIKSRKFWENPKNIQIAKEKMQGENNPMYGIHLNGEKAPNWQGGKSFEPYGVEFNNELKHNIRKRDNYICQKCGKHQAESERALDVHHIDYNKKNNKPKNLISLCKSCHSKTFFNREHWKQYFKEIKCQKYFVLPQVAQEVNFLAKSLRV